MAAGFAAVSPETTNAPKFKRRAVSAVRSYPEGCGPAALTACQPAGAPPAPESSPADPSEPTVQSKLSSPPAPEKNEDSSIPQVQSPIPCCKPVIEPKPYLSSNIFGPPKKRAASAIRTFPFGCGSDAKRTKLAEHERHDLSSEIKIGSLVVEKPPVLETQDIEPSPLKAVDKPRVVEKHKINPSTSRAKSGEKKPPVLETQEIKPSQLKAVDKPQVVEEDEINPSTLRAKSGEKKPPSRAKSAEKRPPVLETQDIKPSPLKAVDKTQTARKNKIKPSPSRAKSAEISAKTKKKPPVLDKQETIQSPLKDIKPSPVARKMAEKSPVIRKVVKKSPAVESKKNHTDENLKESASLTAPGDRIIVQCLMASLNCPWGKGRQRVPVNIRTAY